MIAILAPEYFPRLAFFALARAADTVVLGDTFQYSRQSGQNRALLRSGQGPHWLTVPLLGGQHGKPQHLIQPDSTTPWPTRHLRAMRFDLGTTPYFDHLFPEIEDVLSRPVAPLAELNVATIKLLARWLGVADRFVLASALRGSPSSFAEVVDLLRPNAILSLPEAVRHDARFAPVTALGWQEMPRPQRFPGFVPGLSALDAVAHLGLDVWG